MGHRITIVAAVAAATLASATGVEFGQSRATHVDGAAYLRGLLNPVDIATQLCSTDDDGYASGRAPFLRMATLYAAEMPAATDDGQPPLWEGLGDLDMDISTGSPEAQAYFNQGLRFANDFNHGEAVRSFRWAQSLDGNCAMCFWGEALALGPNINAPMDADAAALAWAALQRAAALAAGASELEQALIRALQQRYAEVTA